MSVFPRKKKEDNLEQQTAQAGLASMETLDDKSTDDKHPDDLKNIALGDNDKNDVEGQDQNKQQTWQEKLMAYKAAICKFSRTFCSFFFVLFLFSIYFY